jgi:uncharacterized protein (TIGR02757 family)
MSKLLMNDLKSLLDEAHDLYNSRDFIELDPILIPHAFSKKEDIEIAGFLSASIAWGNRKSILQNANKLLEYMDHSPYDFVLHHNKTNLKPFYNFVHRTFNGTDCVFFIQALKHVYKHHGGLEKAFSASPKSSNDDLKIRLHNFRKRLLEVNHASRSEKHISDPLKNSASKRLNMFLRWMVRKDKRGVDFGIWKSISPSELRIPLDVHTANISRQLGLLNRKQNDWKAVEELTASLRMFNPDDPVKYDFALFGLGVNKVLK